MEYEELEELLNKVIRYNLSSGKSKNIKVDEKKVIDINEVSTLTGLKLNTIRAKVFRNEIPCFQKGKPLLFKKEAILEWINNGRKNYFMNDSIDNN